MREVSRFYGIVIEMEIGDTAPAHFHVSHEGAVALIGIDELAVLKGRLPPRALGLVLQWASRRQQDLRQAWRRAQHLEDPGPIAPLD